MAWFELGDQATHTGAKHPYRAGIGAFLAGVQGTTWHTMHGLHGAAFFAFTGLISQRLCLVLYRALASELVCCFMSPHISLKRGTNCLDEDGIESERLLEILR